MLLHHSRVIGLGSGDAVTHGVIEQFFNGTLVEQLLDSLFIQSPAHAAEGIGNLVIHPAYILDLKVVSSHCRHPPMSNGIQIGHRHDMIVVGVDQEGLVLQIFPKLFSHGPLEGQELQFRRVIFQLASLEAATSIGDGMVMTVVLLLGEHRSQSFYRGICLKQEGLPEVCERKNTGAMRHFILSSWNATKASGGSPTR